MKSSSFCPHCGYVQEESQWDKLTRGLTGRKKPTKATLFSSLVALALAGIFLYRAFVKGSLSSILFALVALAGALQAWLSKKHAGEEAESEESAESKVEDAIIKEPTALSEHIYCENCGTEVTAEALQCPKCGKMFG